MAIYLASRYSRRAELCEYMRYLQNLGCVVTSRWLDGDHDAVDNGVTIDASDEEIAMFAREDWQDLMAADICISFTEPPRSEASRGGRHVEFGAALAAGKWCIVIGYRENVFHHLPQVDFYASWEQFAKIIEEDKKFYF